MERTFTTGSKRDDDSNKPLTNHLTGYLRLRFGHLLRRGANKYGIGNWKLGQPTETAEESMDRHLSNYLAGDRSEDHLSAIIFNVQLIMMNEQKDGVEAGHWNEKPQATGLAKAIADEFGAPKKDMCNSCYLNNKLCSCNFQPAG